MKSKTGQESKYREHLLSDINIYLAIYSLNSYIFEYNLLKPEDRHLYHQLQDKFDERLVSKVTEDVKNESNSYWMIQTNLSRQKYTSNRKN